MKLQSSSQLEKTRIYLSDLISFLLYLVISLSIVNDLWFPLPVRKGLQRYKLFLNLQIFLYNFLKNSSFSRTPIYNKVSTYDLYSIY